VLALSPVINKIFVPQAKSDRILSFCLSESEMDIVSQLQDSAIERERSLFEEDSSLSLSSLLEEIDCTERVKKLLLVSDKTTRVAIVLTSSSSSKRVTRAT
jgi:hypothetical protein